MTRKCSTWLEGSSCRESERFTPPSRTSGLEVSTTPSASRSSTGRSRSWGSVSACSWWPRIRSSWDTRSASDGSTVTCSGWSRSRRVQSRTSGGTRSDTIRTSSSNAFRKARISSSTTAIPCNAELITATCDYGGEWVASIRKDNILAVQFHPEKSQRNGLRLLRNFLNFIDAD